MPRKKILEKRLARLQKKKAALTQRALASQDANEVRSINEQLEDLNEDIAETEEEIAACDEEPAAGADPTLGDPVPDDPQRQNVPQNAELRGMAPLAAFSQTPEVRDNRPYSSMEYRMAFKEYVQRGTPIPADVLTRAGGDKGTTVTTDIGMIIPMTIMDEFIKEVSKVYGQIYAKVRKLNVKGGIKFPISKLKANFKWITETTVSDKQKAGDIKDYVEFSYNIGEIRVATTLLAEVVSLSLFESEITRIMVEAYVEAMDKAIINGSGEGQPLGILNDTRVTSQTGHVIEFTAAEISDWEKWRKKLFSIIPLSKRGLGQFIFTSATVESNLLTMKDGNNRPIFKEATELTIGESATAGKFYGREVTLVEPDIVSDFDTASSGDVIGIYWVPTDYAINTNLAFGMKRYFDENTNEWINKGITIVDGKMLDVAGCYIIKKK